MPEQSDNKGADFSQAPPNGSKVGTKPQSTDDTAKKSALPVKRHGGT